MDATLPVRNVSAMLGNKQRTSRHGSLFPDSVRALFVGPSGCGKTNSAVSMLVDINGLKFEHVRLYTTTPSQPIYDVYLRRALEKTGVTFEVCSKHDEVTPPQEAKRNTVFVFDDVMTEKQDCIRAYFAAGRHNGVDVLYLAQTYTMIPKQVVRDNANIIVLFKQDNKNLTHVFKEHAVSDFPSFADFRKMCDGVWRKAPHNFLFIDTTRGNRDGRYREGFDTILVL